MPETKTSIHRWPSHPPPHPPCQGLDQQLSELSTQDNSGKAAEQQRAMREYEEKVGGGERGGAGYVWKELRLVWLRGRT